MMWNFTLLELYTDNRSIIIHTKSTKDNTANVISDDGMNGKCTYLEKTFLG